jgi:hypothetical protein
MTWAEGAWRLCWLFHATGQPAYDVHPWIMTSLEDLTVGARVEGIVPGVAVSIVV